MKTNSTLTANKLTRLILAAIVGCFIVTGRASTSSRVISEPSGSSNIVKVAPRVRAVVGNLVALKHDGKTIYVNESAVEAQLSRGDTLALNDDGKTIYDDERELQAYLNQL